MASGSDEVRFKNDYGHEMYVAYMRLDWDCLGEGGEPWRVKGWIKLEPGETKYRANPTENRWFYYYAEAIDGAVWIGPVVVHVRDSVFDTCSGVGYGTSGSASYWYNVGMRTLDTAKWGGVRFTP